MKYRLAVVLIVTVLPRAFAIFGAGDVVFDPINNGVLMETKIETLAKWAEAIKHAEDQVANQVKQIDQAKRLVDGQNQLRATIGDWQGVVSRAKTLNLSAEKLTKDYSETVRNSLVVDFGQPNVAPKNAFGQVVTIRAEDVATYKNLEDVTRAATNVLAASAAESKTISQEIAETYQEMTKSGITQQEYEKLRGKIQTLGLRQQTLQAQRQDALAMIQAQQTATQNQAAKEAAVSRQLQESNHTALVDGLAQIQFDALVWR